MANERSAGVELVWNKGIAALCDHRFPDEFPQGSYVPVAELAGALYSRKLRDDLIEPAAAARIGDGDLVWVRIPWLRSFIRQVLPRTNASFVLVSGDSDSSVPYELGEDARALLDSPRVLHWFTQNHDGSARDRVSPIPIGLDFHMVAQRPIWGEPQATPAGQEKQLRAIAAALPPLAARLPKIYLDFTAQKGWALRHHRRFHPLRGATLWEARGRTVRRFRDHPLAANQATFLPRSEMWRQRGQYAFVLSPHGMGLDCHRTWEALALGHIVLTPSSSIDPLFEGLPVVAFRRWEELTADNLRRWLGEYEPAGPDSERLTSAYWLRKMRAVGAAARGHAAPPR